MSEFIPSLNNVYLRSEKGRPLSGTELDGNFKNLREYMKAFDPSDTDLNLATDELFKFGNTDEFTLGTDGSSLIIKANKDLGGHPAFVVKHNDGTDLLKVMENGDIYAEGLFQIDPNQLNLDLTNLTDLSTQYLTLSNQGTENDLSDQESGTIAFAGGELFVKI